MFAFLDDWPLTKKMLAAFSFLGLLLVGLAINGWVSNRDLTGIARKHVEVSVAGMSNMSDVISDIKEMRIIVYSHYNALTDEERAKLQKRLDTASDELDKDLKAFAAVADPSMAGDIAKMTTIKGQLDDTNRRIFEADVVAKDSGLKLIKGEGKERSHDALDQAQKILDTLRKASEEANARGNASAFTALILTIGLSLISITALGVVWLVINRTIAQPMAALAHVTKTLAEGGSASVPSLGRGDELGEIARAVEQFRLSAQERAQIDARAAAEQQMVTNTVRESLVRVAQGDLTADVTTDFPAAYAELKANLNEALSSLRELIGSVTASTHRIRTGSSEIAQASEDLARRTEANAAALEQTAAAVTQMDQRLKATATAASSTVQRADQAISVVSSGRGTADEAVQAMTRVSESAKGIDSVIEGLDKIAFQTRVLAMNAAVEAGRAGEAGRGFAVVADLVSALAMRAEEEAGRARDQLTATQADIVTAVGMVEKVDGALSNISSDVGEVHQLLGRIASDNQAQSSAISEISDTIGTMDQSTQQNAAMVEETSAAARNLTSEVASLAEQAERFNIGKPSPGVRAPASSGGKPIATRARSKAKSSGGGYVSPVKPMVTPVATASAGSDEWTSF